ncbi:MAG: Tim44 domain-containing protein [Betaproteobacteria bacterium]|nr:Tim44 domain-containing protein [Betaproteobacteria bacterium]
MKKLFVGLCTVLLGASLTLEPAQAKRLGGGGSTGAQRSISGSPPAAAPARPAQQAQPAAPSQAKPAAPQSAGSRWGGILGGLALGGMLGWMLGSSGMAGPIMSMLMFALLAFAAFFVFRMIMVKRNPASAQMQYAGLGNETVAAPPPSQIAGFEAQPASKPSADAAAPANIPAGFDVAGFVRQAKINYIKLQAINDSGKTEELREYTTPEMFASLRGEPAQTAGQHTDVVTLNADLLEVVTEADKHWASVRFSGLVREEPGQAPTPFEEVWNLSKPLDGSSGWLLAGIQQMH